ncbi:hypothetical protein [Dyadobacter sp. CY356]|uniref:hypothetical protein n=1 Tax=Dyadobacter sp. CY356 TaxID=2906442 RepID=UPI001F3246B0|nr:hypothetical protein [Dyadobacter sp. CY356]MCF0059733.1 hypothetical protein [Dyadobacter sp. CY356]
MKNLLSCISLLMIFLLSVGCKEDNVQSKDIFLGGVIVVQSTNIRISDKAGNDLLNPANENRIKDFKVFYVRDGQKKLFLVPNLDHPMGYQIVKHGLENYYYLKVLLDGGKGVKETTTYLQVENGEIDAIKCKYMENTGASVISERVWFNDQLMWYAGKGTESSFEIIK